MADFDIQQVPDQPGKIALVTGANAGLGYETAKALAGKQFKVILACRNEQKGRKAMEEIKREHPKADLEFLKLDLSHMDKVREAATDFLGRFQQLNLLINNAGVMMPPYTVTPDGFELQLATNHLGHFLLTGLLLDTVLATPDSRIVSLSSLAHQQGKIHFEDLQSEKKYSKMGAYAQSKLACLMYAYELQRRLEAHGHQTISVAAHPGIATTELARHFPTFLKIIAPALALFIAQSPKAGAEPTLYAALGSDIEGGDYTGPNSSREFKGRATKVGSTALSKEAGVAKRLWEVSEELSGLKYL